MNVIFEQFGLRYKLTSLGGICVTTTEKHARIGQEIVEDTIDNLLSKTLNYTIITSTLSAANKSLMIP